MSSIEQVRAAMQSATYRTEQVVAALQSSALELDQIDALLQNVGQGSSNEHYNRGALALIQATEPLRQALELVRTGETDLNTYAAQI
ncbi:hypothetical protein A8924_7408 [Saccharopolyspora erythraea NRRL 2338]|uniref:Uncharacterized protein n=2 Tax=Saccharopolyspora erythraea TaxID=1836 RepID=A4FQ53_SACEN|nr:hypothetical protein [Saccharopolyspora erythraea]EQD84390.1 hypothetical protein N599_20280 [Saccharopolyspora erythraea D]PFG99824.1 hypothetical protein A8924_7379 [Saccharopolyspora erythraea NRRL 2338]PFG99850.1 hypothetical protein A8924_7408 [Saccharopolyspora erythraea NRRL 2338]QRK89695.1 hypothetical protein JQX30_35130 [Saccharopolyspora erythraea]CAM06178.1 hypothetical protein SACE_7017 [Saccharopolyspora erythraea NRRL 2338]